MIHSLNLKSCDRGGLKTKEELESITKMKPDYIQGYYFYRPMKKDEFSEKLDQNS